MKPFGHTETREGRDTKNELLDNRLHEPWRQYLFALASKNYMSAETQIAFATQFLKPALHSIADLHHHILMMSHETWTMRMNLGYFISAGYQLLPEEEIVYDLHTPDLNALGAFLDNKHLIIEGAVGDYLGYTMSGKITNNGTIGRYAARKMIGTFTNNGVTGDNPADQMIGVFVNNGTRGAFTPNILGKYDGWWNVSNKELRPAFLQDIDHPSRLEHNQFEKYLREKYR